MRFSHRCEESRIPGRAPLRSSRSQPEWLFRLEKPPRKRQRKDMVLLAHIRERFRLSQETYGSPRMHADLIEDGIKFNRRGARCWILS
jgi:hypothetical protein